jgi:hypothetical protein
MPGEFAGGGAQMLGAGCTDPNCIVEDVVLGVDGVFMQCQKSADCPRQDLNASGKHGGHCGVRLSIANPELSGKWHPRLNGQLRPYNVSAKSNDKAWWLCENCGHEWEVKIANRSSKGTGCSKCAGRVATADNNLKVLNPELADEWVECVSKHGLTAETVLPKSGRKVLWQCPTCAHQWEARIAERSEGHGCPVCNTGGIQQKHRDFEKDPLKDGEILCVGRGDYYNCMRTNLTAVGWITSRELCRPCLQNLCKKVLLQNDGSTQFAGDGMATGDFDEDDLAPLSDDPGFQVWLDKNQKKHGQSYTGPEHSCDVAGDGPVNSQLCVNRHCRHNAMPMTGFCKRCNSGEVYTKWT